MDNEIMVDDGFHRRRSMTPRQLQALSNVCGNCRGLCCVRFRLFMRTKVILNDNPDVVGWEIDWEAEERACAGNAPYASDLAFARSNFTPVRVGPPTWNGRSDVLCTCKHVDPVTHKCNAYESRPTVCRIYMCTSAFYLGYPPDNAEHKMEAQRVGEPFEGWVPDKTPDPLWAETIKVMIDEEKRECEERARNSPSIGLSMPARADGVCPAETVNSVSDVPALQGFG